MKRILASFVFVFLLSACSHNESTVPAPNAKNTGVANPKVAEKSTATAKATPVTQNSKVNPNNTTPAPWYQSFRVKPNTETTAKNNKENLPVKISDFPVNKIATYYQVPFTILKIEKNTVEGTESKELETGKTIEEKAYLTHTITPEKLAANPTGYIENLQVKYQRRNYINLQLSGSHKELLRTLLNKTDPDKNKLALIFVNGYKLKHYEQQIVSVEKTVYAQYVTDFLYKIDPKIRVEKRYVTDMPEDEIFIIILGFDGKVPYNVYNAPKLDSIQWLSRYMDYEYQQNSKSRKEDEKIDQVIENATDAPEGLNTITKEEMEQIKQQQEEKVLEEQQAKENNAADSNDVNDSNNPEEVTDSVDGVTNQNVDLKR